MLSTASTSSSTSPSSEITWVIDNGASRHYSTVRSDFINFKTLVVENVSGIDCEVKEVGDIDVTEPDCMLQLLSGKFSISQISKKGPRDHT
jgi:hypothetical protein